MFMYYSIVKFLASQLGYDHLAVYVSFEGNSVDGQRETKIGFCVAAKNAM